MRVRVSEGGEWGRNEGLGRVVCPLAEIFAEIFAEIWRLLSELILVVGHHLAQHVARRDVHHAELTHNLNITVSSSVRPFICEFVSFLAHLLSEGALPRRGRAGQHDVDARPYRA